MKQSSYQISDFFRLLGVTYLDQLLFSNRRLEKRVRDSWKNNRDPVNGWLGSYFAEEWKNHKHPKIRIRYSDTILGYGVFAAEKIAEKRYIGEYTGVVRKKSLWMLFTNPYCVEYPVGFSTLRRYVIDGAKQGNFTRFINHSKTPNLEMRSSLFEDGLIHMIFYTNKPIENGEQLTIDYGRRFWIESMKRPD